MTNPDYLKVQYGNVSVNYVPVLDGGGMTIGQQYLDVVRQKLGRVEHVFEFCAGPGFIGFSMLANGLCDRLTLADINPEAVEAARATIAENKLEDRVTVYESDCLDSIPATEKWDLVVSNPPHFDGDQEDYKAAIRLIDPGFEIHKRFYRDVKKFLKPSGHVIIQENGSATHFDDFAPMIRDNGLKLVEVFRHNGADLPLKPQKKKRSAGQKAVEKIMKRIEQALMNSAIERLVKGNAVFRRVSMMPVFLPKNIYFMWSRPQDAI
jgi:methylase of polypeptide subunit release factors